jgi:teichuronic acid biosynthesis glycosyltransferase TuaC
MKILLVTTVFPSPLQPNKGAFNREMVRALGASHELQVIAPVAWPIAYRARRDGQTWEGARRLDGIEVRHPVYFYTPKLLRPHYGAFFWWSIRRTVNQMLRGFEPDVVIGYWAHPDGQAAVHVAHRLSVPAVVMVGGTDVLVLGTGGGRRRAIRRVLEDADAIVAVSQDLKRRLHAWELPASKVHVVRRGIDVTRFKPGDRDAARRRLGITPGMRMLLWVGHMVPVKGLEVLIEACAEAAARTDFHLYLVGHGALHDKLRRRSIELGLEARVTFVGYVPHADLPNWYSAADLTVLPSHSEGIPNVLLESIASGTPFVATRVGGIPEIADPLLDRLVAAADAGALANAIVDSLAAPSRIDRRAMPISTATDAAERMLDVLASTVSAHRRVPSMNEAAVSASGGDAVGAQP